MPAAKNPNAREFYVYAFVARGYPFYVGMGRAGRASDRLRYVEYLMRREKQGKPVKWVTSNRVIAALLSRGIRPILKTLASGLTRPAALKREKVEIVEHRQAGYVLANRVYNGGSVVSAEQVLAAILAASER